VDLNESTQREIQDDDNKALTVWIFSGLIGVTLLRIGQHTAHLRLIRCGCHGMAQFLRGALWPPLRVVGFFTSHPRFDGGIP